MKKSSRHTIQAAVFTYDCFRLVFLLAVLALYQSLDPAGPLGMFQGETRPGPSFPSTACAAPNALFPLMSFFLLIRFSESKSFVPLYVTGKIISMAALLGWVCFAALRAGALPRHLWWVFFISAADLVTVLGTASRRAAPGGPEEAAVNKGGE